MSHVETRKSDCAERGIIYRARFGGMRMFLDKTLIDLGLAFGAFIGR
mgnify:CR=1 FL=1